MSRAGGGAGGPVSEATAGLAGAPPNAGLCQCGCGQATTVLRGQPRRFISGHNSWKHEPQYEPVDCGYETPCWLWRWAVAPNGYGLADDENGRKLGAHRLYYERARGLVPEGLELDHLCRQRSCVNPAHLEAVPRAVNLRRGRGTKLTEDAVREIRTSSEPNARLAQRFGISGRHVRKLRAGTSWREVTP